MKKYLYVLTPWVKWLANFVIIMLVFTYLVPASFNKYLDLSIGWVISFLLAMVFAYWAFYKTLPSDKQLFVYLIIWIVVTLIMELIIDVISFPDPLSMFLRYELLVQIILEIAGVFVIHRAMKRQQAYHLAAPE